MPGILIIAHAPLASALKSVAMHAYPDCARRIEALIALYTLWSDLDEATTARLNDVMLRLNREALDDLARLIEQPDDEAALSGLQRWISAMHADKVRSAKAIEREPDATEDMIDLRVTPTI